MLHLKFKIDSGKAKSYMLQQLQQLPLNPVMVVEVKSFQKIRTSDQNRLMWKSLLGDFAEQAFVDGRLFAADVWHEHLKQLFLPEKSEIGITKDNYKKYIELPDGKLKMVGSTTMLTTKGFSDYIEKCYAFGCDLGVKFAAKGEI